MIPVRSVIPGTCNICQETVPGNRIRRQLMRCVQARTGLMPSQDPLRKDRRRTTTLPWPNLLAPLTSEKECKHSQNHVGYLSKFSSRRRQMV